MLSYVVFRAAWGLLAALPLTAARRLLETAAVLAMRIDRHHRRVIEANLAVAFPDWSPLQTEHATRAAFISWGRIVAELAHEPEVVAAIEARVVEEVERAAAGLLERGRGLLVLTAHTGNFELLARMWGRRTGRSLASFHRALSNRLIDDHLISARAAAGFITLPRRRGIVVREALRVLARGDILVVPLDQNQPLGKGVFVDMFAKPASTSTMLARLALASAAPVLPVFAAWDDGRVVAVVGEAIELPEGATRARGAERQALLLELTASYTRAIEAVIRRFPEQWNWAHRRWKTRPPGETLGRRSERQGGDKESCLSSAEKI